MAPGTVTTLRVIPKKSGEFPLPSVIKQLPQLLSLIIDMKAVQGIPFRKLKAKRMPSTLQRLVISTNYSFPGFFQTKSGSWVDMYELFPRLVSLTCNIDILDSSMAKWIARMPGTLRSLQIGKWQMNQPLPQTISHLRVHRLLSNAAGDLAIPADLTSLEIVDRVDPSCLPFLIPALGRSVHLESLRLGTQAYPWKRSYYASLPRTLQTLQFYTKPSNELNSLFEEEEKLISDNNKKESDAQGFSKDDSDRVLWQHTAPVSPRRPLASSLKLPPRGAISQTSTSPPTTSIAPLFINSAINWPERLVSLETFHIPLSVWNSLPRTLTRLSVTTCDSTNDEELLVSPRLRRAREEVLARQLSALPRGLLHLTVTNAPAMRLNGPLEIPPLLQTFEMKAIQLDNSALESFGPVAGRRKPRASSTASKTASSPPTASSSANGSNSPQSPRAWTAVVPTSGGSSCISRHRELGTGSASPRSVQFTRSTLRSGVASGESRLTKLAMRHLDERLAASLPQSLTSLSVHYLADFSPALVQKLPKYLSSFDSIVHDHQFDLFDEDQEDIRTLRQGPPSPRHSSSGSSSNSDSSDSNSDADSDNDRKSPKSFKTREIDEDLLIPKLQIPLSPKRATLAVRPIYNLPKHLNHLSVNDYQQLGDGLIESLSNSALDSLQLLSIAQASLVSDLSILWIPKRLVSLRIDASEAISGAVFAALPRELKTLSLASSSAVVDDQLADLPRTLTFLNLASATHITNEGIKILPDSLVRIKFTKNKLLTVDCVKSLKNPVHHRAEVTFEAVEPSFECERFTIINAAVKTKEST